MNAADGAALGSSALEHFDLLARTPPASALAVRRSRRLSHSAAKDTLDA